MEEIWRGKTYQRNKKYTCNAYIYFTRYFAIISRTLCWSFVAACCLNVLSIKMVNLSWEYSLRDVQSFCHDPCASRTTQLLFSTGAKRALPVDVLCNYTQFVNSGSVSYFPTLTNSTRCFPGSISYCATIEIISTTFYCHLIGWQAWFTTLWPMREWCQCLPWLIPSNIPRPILSTVKVSPHYQSSPTAISYYFVRPFQDLCHVSEVWPSCLLYLCIPKLRQSDLFMAKHSTSSTKALLQPRVATSNLPSHYDISTPEPRNACVYPKSLSGHSVRLLQMFRPIEHIRKKWRISGGDRSVIHPNY